jgi:diguanylate cyclase (GGDEF)-like protein/PAS domain S-box-containing protein
MRESDFLGKTRWDVEALNLDDEGWDRHRRTLERHESFRDFEIRRPDRDGRENWIAISGEPIYDENGGFRGYRGIGREITARKLAEKALRESEERFRSLTELTSDYYWEQDEQMRFTKRIGMPWEKRFSPGEDIIGKTRWELAAPNMTGADWARHRADLEARREFHDLEIERPLPAGGSRWISTSGRPIFDDQGRFRGYRGVGQDITERKAAEITLRESMRLRETLMRNLPGMVYRCANDPQWTVEFASEGCEALTGYAPDEFVGNRTLAYADIIHPEDRDGVWRDVQAALAQHGPFELHYRIRSKDGATRWVWERGSGVYAEDGALLALEGYVTDVTARVQAERTLRESERRYRALVELSSDWYWRTDENHRFTFRQGEVLGRMGMPPAADYGKTRWELDFINMSPADWEAHREVLQRRDMFHGLLLARRNPDGRVYWAAISGRPLLDEQGRFLGYHGIGREVTAQVLAEQALHETVSRLTLIADNVPAMIAYTDSEFRYRYANRHFVDFYFGKGTAYEGKHMLELQGAEVVALVKPGIERALAGETMRYEGPRRRADGAVRHVDVTLVPHRDGEGRVLGVYTFILDVTERHEADEKLRTREAQLRLVMDSVPAMIAYVGTDLRYRYANRGYRDFYGDGQPVEGRTLADFLGRETWSVVQGRIGRALLGEIQIYSRVHRRRSGKTRNVDVSLIPHRDALGRVAGLYILTLDVTSRRRSEEALRLRTRALESSMNSVMITRPTAEGQQIVYVNAAFERTTGYSASDVMGRSPRFLHRDDRDQAGVEALRAAAREQRETTVLLRNYRKDGTLFWNELRVAPVRDDAGVVTHFIGISSDVTDRVKYEEQIERHANYDTLTGLPNRNLLNDRLSQALVKSARSKRTVGVLYVDVDHLKRINDSIGHATGDQVIAAVAARLAATVRTGDTVARVGGDEFVIVLAELNREDDAATVATKIRNSVGTPLKIGSHEFVLSASLGIALHPKDGADAPTLLRNADAALYRAKEQGRDCFRFFAPEMNERAVQFLALESDLRRALEAGEFRLQYQPIVRLNGGEVVGVEALIRWRRPDGSMVPPAQFIPVAEESGLIVPIGRWVLETAVQQAGKWNRKGRAPLFVSVNLSARQFRDPGLVETVGEILRRAKVEPALIKLEITESTVMQNMESTERSLKALKKLGLQLSVDDFGTGYSSLGYLKRFPLDTLKIDRSFVKDLPGDSDDLAISRAVIDLGRGLDLDVVAEGVETPAQADALRANGCAFAQGYLFGRPMDAAAIVPPERPVRRPAKRKR